MDGTNAQSNVSRLLVLQVKLNGDPIQLLVDTRSDLTLVSDRYCNKYSIPTTVLKGVKHTPRLEVAPPSQVPLSAKSLKKQMLKEDVDELFLVIIDNAPKIQVYAATPDGDACWDVCSVEVDRSATPMVQKPEEAPGSVNTVMHIDSVTPYIALASFLLASCLT
jgi:hypothetical protein